MVFTKKQLKFILFAAFLPVFWSSVHATSDDEGERRPKRTAKVKLVSPMKRPRSRFWAGSSDSGSDTSEPQSPNTFVSMATSESPPPFSLGGSQADINASLYTALDRTLTISRPATPSTGLVLEEVKKLLIKTLRDNEDHWTQIIELVDDTRVMPTVGELVEDLIAYSSKEKLQACVWQLVAHAFGSEVLKSDHQLQEQLSRKLSHPYLALLNVIYKINASLQDKLTHDELMLPVIHYSHIFTPESESGYHFEDTAFNRRVDVAATNPHTGVYGGTWRKRNGLPKFSNFFPKDMDKDTVCKNIREAFANRVAESLEINGTAKQVLLGKSSSGIYIEMPTYFGISVNAYPIFTYTTFPESFDQSWSVTLGNHEYSYTDMLEIIRDAVFNHHNEAIRYTDFERDGKHWAIVDIAISDKFDLPGITYGVYVQVPANMVSHRKELRAKNLDPHKKHRRTPLQRTLFWNELSSEEE